MALIGMRDVCWGFGDSLLLDNITLQVEKGERIGVLGRNGVGKSTLFKLFSGEMRPDSGDILCGPGIRVAALAQDVPGGFDGTIFDVVAEGFGDAGRAMAEHARIGKIPESALSAKQIKRRDELQHLLDSDNGWALLPQIERVLSMTGLDPEKPFAALSAGMKRRTLFARAMAVDPDVLLLDEPTNHLDIDAILWMEEFILRHVKTLLFITHDRTFLKNIATKIMELDRGRLSAYDCGYERYLQRRQAELDAEEKQNGVFDKKLAEEEVWIRQGIKARRTRNEGRVRALMKLREEYRARRSRIGNANLQVQEAERTGKLVIEAKSVSLAYNGKPVISDFSTLIMRGDKVGIIGPNGVGKTTLLNLLLKKITPDTGNVRHGTNLQVAYFDQLRAYLDEEKTVAENIGEGNSYIDFNGRKRHVIGYLKDFLFSPERSRTPVWVLSGGEKNRLLLAKLFTRPSNVIVMDEPTNDLDAETLELLEERLLDYSGTVLLVSHDRTFVNNVVTSTIAFEPGGRVLEYPGGYDDWLIQRPKPEKEAAVAKKPEKKVRPKTSADKPRKLGFKEMRELESLPQTIEALEKEHQELVASMSDPMFYKTEKAEIARIQSRLTAVEREIETAYRRWEALEAFDK